MTIFTDKVKQFNTRLMSDLQITEEQAAGIWGNIGTETGGFKYLQEIKPVVAGSKGGYGWMQWTGPRRRKYLAWCEAQQLNPADDETNYKYLVFETKSEEAKSLTQLRKTTTVEAATFTFMKLNLRPGVEHIESRQNWAKQAYNAMKDQNKAVATTGTAAGAVVATGGAAALAPPDFWQWIAEHMFFTLSSSALVIGGIIYLIHRHNENQKKVVLPDALIQKGKRNGKTTKTKG